MNNFIGPLDRYGSAGFRPEGMFVSDFDGTLRSSSGTIAERDLETLRELGRAGFLRVIATGRTLYSLNKAIDDSLPVDYIVFSSGAGVLDFQKKRIVRKMSLDAEGVRVATEFLIQGGHDFMIHAPIPDNHRFLFVSSGRENPDFARRCSLYSQFCDAFDGRIETLGPGTQLLVIEPPASSPPSLDGFEKALPNCSIIRTTSPLDGASHWIEIFPKGISKGQTTDWLAKEWGLGPEDCLAIGNDYNDLDLLKWSHRSFVVANAPPELRREFDMVASVDRCGVTEAVQKWLPLKRPGKP